MFGIPKLLNQLPRAVGITLLGNSANALIDFLFPTPNWGVYKKGTTTKAFDVSSVVELDISGESNVSDYPIEGGTFTTYNKVLLPNAFGIRMTRDGNQEQRTAFLNWLNTTLGSFELFDILCPEYTYKNVTLKSYRISRTSESGASMVSADCLFQEVRQIPASYTTTRIPAPANQPASPAARTHPVPDQTVLQGFPI